MVPGTYIYVDMANSTKLAATQPHLTVAKVIKGFLATATRILRHYDGHIRSFDGDRVMAIFVGDGHCNRAVTAAWKIHWAISEIVDFRFGMHVDGLFKANWKMRAGIGIDTGIATMVRAGIRKNNDLVSIGDAPNVAAKLSEIRENIPNATYITEAVWSALDFSMCYQTDAAGNAKDMWTQPVDRDLGGRSEEVRVSRFYWTIA